MGLHDHSPSLLSHCSHVRREKVSANTFGLGSRLVSLSVTVALAEAEGSRYRGFSGPNPNPAQQEKPPSALLPLVAFARGKKCGVRCTTVLSGPWTK